MHKCRYLIIALSLFLIAPRYARAELTLVDLQVATDGDKQIFLVSIKKPDDYQSLSQIWAQGQNAPLYAHPRLRPQDVSDRTQIYFEPGSLLGYSHSDVVSSDNISFAGRANKAANLDLVLEYSGKDRSTRREALKLDLGKAKTFKATARPTPNTGAWQPTPSAKLSSTISAAERFANAQADHFGYMRMLYGDTGGFFSFAEQTTKRSAGLPFIETDTRPNFAQNRNSAEMMYDTTTGALAIQESLQLDRMLAAGKMTEAQTIDISTMSGVQTQSHPFDQMRAGKEPVYNPIANFAPIDNYILSFNGVEKLLQLVDFLDQWGSSALELYEAESIDYDVHGRLQRQLALPDSLLARFFGDQVVSQTAITGNDPFLREGSDVSILFEVKNRELFEQSVNTELAIVKAANPDAQSTSFSIGDIKVEALTNSDRTISSYRAWIDSVVVYSNSRVALERIVKTKQGQIQAVSSAPDFKYMRSVVYPYDPKLEDGFLYLSDDFIRHLVSPQVRIKEKRRIEALTSLKMLTNAQLLQRYQQGNSVEISKAELIKAKVLNKGDLVGAGSQDLEWDSARHRAVSASYGTLRFMTPLVELPIDKVSESERSGYQTFVQNYEHYWRRYFDPIGVRIKVGTAVKFDVTILPLIADSSYDSLKDTSSGSLVRVDPKKFPPDTLFRLVFHINPQGRDLQSFKSFFTGMAQQDRNSSAPSVGGLVGSSVNLTDWIGEWFSIWVAETGTLKEAAQRAYAVADGNTSVGYSDPFNDISKTPLVLGIHQKNGVSLAAFLVALRSLIQGTAPDMVSYTNLEPYKNVTIVKISEGRNSPMPPTPGVEPPAVYYATVGDGFYLSTQTATLKSLIDHSSGELSLVAKDAAAQAETFDAHAFNYVSAGPVVRDTVRFLLEQQAYAATLRNFGAAWIIGRMGFANGQIDDETQFNLLGYRLASPGGGTYSYDAATDLVSSSVYGSMREPKRRSESPLDSPVSKMVDSVERLISTLRFTEEGLQATVQIDRKE